MLQFLDSSSKKKIIFSFIVYFPIMSLLAGAPLPFPSIFEPTQSQIAMLNGLNVSIAIIGSIVGATFYLERRNNKKIERVEDAISELAIAHSEGMKELRKEMREMEARLCASMDGRNKHMEQRLDEKVKAAKELEDERIRNIQNRINRLDAGGKEGHRFRFKTHEEDADEL